MKNVNLNFDLKSLVPKLLKHFSILLWVVIGLVIVAEAWVIKNSVEKVLQANDQSIFANVQLIRVNFHAYDKIEERLNENARFIPNNPPPGDPFGLRPVIRPVE